jgi:hypothetical protein
MFLRYPSYTNPSYQTPTTQGGGARRTAGKDPLPVLLARVMASIEGASVVEYEVKLGYDDLPLDQVC